MYKIIFTSYNFPKKKNYGAKIISKKEIELFVGDRVQELLGGR